MVVRSIPRTLKDIYARFIDKIMDKRRKKLENFQNVQNAVVVLNQRTLIDICARPMDAERFMEIFFAAPPSFVTIIVIAAVWPE